jgi:hypothetical protein
MHLPIILLLVRPPLNQPRRPIDGGADGGYRRRVEVEEQRREGGRGLTGRRAGGGRVGGESARLGGGCWAVGDPLSRNGQHIHARFGMRRGSGGKGTVQS